MDPLTMERIEQIIKEVESGGEEATKVASGQDEHFDLLAFADEIEKIASEHDNDVSNEEAIHGELEMRSDDLAKQRLKEILLNGIKAENPSPTFQRLRQLLLGGAHTKEAQVFAEGLAQVISAYRSAS